MTVNPVYEMWQHNTQSERADVCFYHIIPQCPSTCDYFGLFLPPLNILIQSASIFVPQSAGPIWQF